MGDEESGHAPMPMCDQSASLAETRLASPANAIIGAGASGRRRKHDIKFKGVYSCRVSGGNFWQAQISVNGTTHHLGVFSSAVDAARAYDEQARIFGRRLNFEDPPIAAPVYGYPTGRARAPSAPSPAASTHDAHSWAASHAASMGGAHSSTGVHTISQMLNLPSPCQSVCMGHVVPAPVHHLAQQVDEQQWVGIPLGEPELAAYWRGAGTISLLAQQAVPQPPAPVHEPLAEFAGPMWPTLAKTDSDEDGAGGSCSSLI